MYLEDMTPSNFHLAELLDAEAKIVIKSGLIYLCVKRAFKVIVLRNKRAAY